MQARFERNAFDEALVKRLNELDLGDAALVFGRIDRRAEQPPSLGTAQTQAARRASTSAGWPSPTRTPSPSSSTGGRRSPSRSTGRPAASRWACCAAATSPSKAAPSSGIEDELFGDGHLGIGHDEGLTEVDAPGAGLRGYSTLLAALERGRTGTLGDIVATIQAEQDEIIRSPQAGVLVVQGGPGTGKTVVALHRAAYLLYTHRFPLGGPGGPRHRAEPGVPALHRAGAPIARRGGRRAGRARRPRPRRAHSPGPAGAACRIRRRRAGSRATRGCRRSSTGRSAIASGRCGRISWSRSGPASCASPSRSRHASSRPRRAASGGTTPVAVTSRASSSRALAASSRIGRRVRWRAAPGAARCP